MKKTAMKKTLKLNKDTLRTLRPDEANKAAGGWTTVVLPGTLSGPGETCGGWSCWWCR